ncbi:hypothetical protein OOT00_15635, partial [Desulfobotulus sp. H1]
LMGLDSETLPDDLARRMAILSEGCMSPELDEQAVVKLFLVLPVFGYTLSETILNLTGEGAELGE